MPRYGSIRCAHAERSFPGSPEALGAKGRGNEGLATAEEVCGAPTRKPPAALCPVRGTGLAAARRGEAEAVGMGEVRGLEGEVTMAWVVPSAATNCHPAASLWGTSPMETTSYLGASDAPNRSRT